MNYKIDNRLPLTIFKLLKTMVLFYQSINYSKQGGNKFKCL